MTNDKLPAKTSSARDIDAFLKRAAKLPTIAQTKGRLIFAIDATMSRQPTWNRATQIQSDMFDVAHSIGG
ncbi:MAG: VWA domain-containing protein, partial [Rhizomicrobium sp.]